MSRFVKPEKKKASSSLLKIQVGKSTVKFDNRIESPFDCSSKGKGEQIASLKY